MIAFWMGLPPWARTALMWSGAIFMLIITGKFIIARHDDKIRREVNAERDTQAAQVESQIITTITENSNEMVRQSDAVRSRPAIVELPDGTQDLPPYHYRD